MSPATAHHFVECLSHLDASVRAVTIATRALLRAVADASGTTACQKAMNVDRLAGRDFTLGCAARGFVCDNAGFPCVPAPSEDA